MWIMADDGDAQGVDLLEDISDGYSQLNVGDGSGGASKQR